MNEHSGRPWPVYLLGLAAIGAIAAAYLVVGPSSQSTASATRIVTAQSGVVASTVSGSGNVEAAKQLDLGFKTGGVVSRIYVSEGQHVVEGQLLAELDPESAEVTLEQARATLKTSEANLEREEETDGEGASSSGDEGARASAASVDYSTSVSSTSTSVGASETAPQSASGANEGSAGQKAPTESGTGTQPQGKGTTGGTSKANADAGQPAGSGERNDTGSKGTSSPSSSSSTNSSGKGSGSTLSSAARAANIASASAAVKSDKLAVQSDEEALANTKLYAPQNGTLVSLSGEVGETVSGTGTTKASSSSSSSSSSEDTGASSTSALGRSSAAASGDSSGDSSSSGSSFAVLSDLSSMQLVVPMSESEIGQVKDGQPATVTIEALEGRKLAAEVTAISMLPTSNSGVVSYDVTFTLDQLAEGLRSGMSATAEVVVKQAEGVNVPSDAITADTVTVLHEGKQVRRTVVTGLAGNSSTIVLSGLSAGEQVVLPAAKSTSGASSLLNRLGSRLGGGGLGGGGFPGGGGGFAARAFGG